MWEHKALTSFESPWHELFLFLELSSTALQLFGGAAGWLWESSRQRKGLCKKTGNPWYKLRKKEKRLCRRRRHKKTYGKNRATWKHWALTSCESPWHELLLLPEFLLWERREAWPVTRCAVASPRAWPLLKGSISNLILIFQPNDQTL